MTNSSCDDHELGTPLNAHMLLFLMVVQKPHTWYTRDVFHGYVTGWY